MTAREKIAIWPSDRASRQTVRAAEVLTGTRVVTVEEVERYQALVFGPNAATRNVDLPPEEQCQGVALEIYNLSTTGGATLVVRDDAAATIVTIPITAAGQRKGARLVCDGAAWFGMLGA
jgi:hypothetical protein